MSKTVNQLFEKDFLGIFKMLGVQKNIFVRNSFFERLMFGFFVFLDFERKIFGLWQKVSAGLSKLHFTSTKERLDDTFSEKVHIFTSLRDFICKKLSNTAESFWPAGEK